MMFRNANQGCFKSFRYAWTFVFFFIALALTGVNLYFSNIFGETCGVIHPYIFEIEVSVIDNEGLMVSARDHVPFQNDEDLSLYEEVGWLTSASGGTLDTYLRVYNADGTVLLAENDDAGGSLSSEISDFSVEEDQQIIIEVGTFSDSYDGRFELYMVSLGEANTITADPQVPEEFYDELIDGGEIDSAQLDTGALVEGEIYTFSRVRYTVDVDGGEAYQIGLAGTQGLQDAGLNATNWSSCLQYFGFVDGESFFINYNGYIWFVPDSLASKAEQTCDVQDGTVRAFLQECVRATVSVSATGRIIFFVMLAGLVVLLPVLIVDALEGQRETIWYVFLLLVAVQATTTAMLFLHLGNVSGIEALSEFGYGIFGGITTGSALVFIDKLVNRAEDGTPMMFPPEEDGRDR